MQLFTSISAVQSYLQSYLVGKSIGFVPTMGALHAGHLSLIEASRQENDLTVCSVYVNPTQFDNPGDLAAYPRTLEQDAAMLQQAGCDVLFAPIDSEMYTRAPLTRTCFGDIEQVLEGRYRQGHFNGVGIVVSKLFNIVRPHRAYFGQKDLQQFLVIKQLVRDLSFNVELRCCPVVREDDGLAMSSRNRRLSQQQRQLAPQLYQALQLAREQVLQKQPLPQARQSALEYLNQFDAFVVDYFEIVDAETLMPAEPYTHQNIAFCVAAHLGNVRLIDNLILSH